MQNLYRCKHFTNNENMNRTCKNKRMCVIYYGEICKEYKDERRNTNNNTRGNDTRNSKH